MESVSAVADQPDAAVERFEASVADSELDRCEHPGLVFADRAGELDEWLELRAGRPREPRVEAFGGFLFLEPVDVAQLAEQQERAVHALVGQHDLGELRQLLGGLVDGVLQEAVAGSLDPAALAGGGPAVAVVLVAPDLVDGAAAELADVERVEAHLCVRQALRGADRFLVAGGHVDRDRCDRRLLLLGELGEEPLQRLGVPAWCGPHHRAAGVVSDARQEPMPGAVADLVHADHHEPVQSAAIELVRDDAGEDLPDRSPPDPHQLGQRRLGHLLRQERDDILEVARVRRARARPRHLLVHIAAARAVHASEHALDLAPQPPEIEMPPTLGPVLLDRQPTRPAARADRSLAPQPDGHDHSLAAERDVLHRRSRKPQHPIECGGDSHVALLRRPLNFEHPAACRRRAAAGRSVRAQPARATTPRRNQAQRAHPRKRDPRLTPRWTGEPQIGALRSRRWSSWRRCNEGSVGETYLDEASAGGLRDTHVAVGGLPDYVIRNRASWDGWA